MQSIKKKRDLYFFNILSWPYWADGGKPTVNGADPDSETAFKDCLKSEKCNFDSVAGYMRNFEQVFKSIIVKQFNVA